MAPNDFFNGLPGHVDRMPMPFRSLLRRQLDLGYGLATQEFLFGDLSGLEALQHVTLHDVVRILDAGPALQHAPRAAALDAEQRRFV
ncbi:MAG: hypothetical protein GY711_07695 [bacterium]|nr:hypothetical protein [bacterium]